MTRAASLGSVVHIEAVRLVDRLAGYAEQMRPELAQLPTQMFQQLCGVDDIAHWLVGGEGIITSEPVFQGKSDFFLAVLRSCALCAHAVRLPESMGWPALLAAERHAGIALAVHVHPLEEKERLSVIGQAMKDAQIEVNSAIRAYVLQEAAGSQERDVSPAAKEIVCKLERDYGNLKAALKHFDSSLKPVDTTLATTFADYIRDDVARFVPMGSDAGRTTPRQRFARWKEVFGLPGKPNH